MVVISIARTYCYRFCFLFMLLLLVGLFSPSAHADGGAPQLAYVAGAAQGISIIDIARRRVTGSIAVDGKPRTVLLSPDGYALYVTQPTLGRVAVIIAKTGKTLCTASLPGQPSSKRTDTCLALCLLPVDRKVSASLVVLPLMLQPARVPSLLLI